MTPEALVPCTCQVKAQRDPKTLLSRTRILVSPSCPHHGLPQPNGGKK